MLWSRDEFYYLIIVIFRDPLGFPFSSSHDYLFKLSLLNLLFAAKLPSLSRQIRRYFFFIICCFYLPLHATVSISIIKHSSFLVKIKYYRVGVYVLKVQYCIDFHIFIFHSRHQRPNESPTNSIFSPLFDAVCSFCFLLKLMLCCTFHKPVSEQN